MNINISDSRVEIKAKPALHPRFKGGIESFIEDLKYIEKIFREKDSYIEGDILKPENKEELKLKYKYFSLSVAAIILSVCCLEEYANSIFINKKEIFDTGNLKKTGFYQKLFFEKTLDKYDRILKLYDKKPLKKGDELYQNLETVNDLRNSLVHAKIEFTLTCNTKDYIKSNSKSIEKKLYKKFPISPFSTEESEVFPTKYLGLGCVEWAWENVSTFMKKFDNN